VEPHSLAEEEEEAATITQAIAETAVETTETPVVVVAVVEVNDLFRCYALLCCIIVSVFSGAHS